MAAANGEPVYLDHNGTTPVALEVAEAMWPWLSRWFGNPSSDSAEGRRAKAALDHAREQVAALIGARPDEVVFTSGGTESNNLAIRGTAPHASHRRLVTSTVEHPATAQPVALLERTGWQVDRLAVDAEGRIDPDDVPRDGLGLGTLIWAQNETGTVQPVGRFAERVHAAGGLAHADAAQALGKVPVDVTEAGVDLLSVAGHKLYAPKAVGALYVRTGCAIDPLLRGAGQEHGHRPGTENVAGIVALGRAAELAAELVTTEPARQRELRDRLWELLSAGIPGLVRISPSVECLPNTLMVAVPGVRGGDLLHAAPAVTASTGSACHAGVDAPSETLLAMGIPPQLAMGSLRLTLGRSTTAGDIERAAHAVIEAHHELTSARH